MNIEETILSSESDLVKKLDLPFLIHSLLSLNKTTKQVTLSVPSQFVVGKVMEKSADLEDYFGMQVLVKLDQALTGLAAENEIKQITPGRLFGSRYLNEEYRITPFFVGSSNLIAFRAMENARKKETPTSIIFLHGKSATGKSHGVQRIAHMALDDGKDVYFNSTNGFIEDIKRGFGEKVIVQGLEKIEFFIIDDIQMLNNTKLTWAHEPLFNIINEMVERGKKLLFTSDDVPRALLNFHERLLTRLQSGIVCEIELPGEDIKGQYVDHYARKVLNIQLKPEIRDFVIKKTRNLREAKGILNLCEVLSGLDLLNIETLIQKTQVEGTDLQRKKYSDLYSLLSNYYGLNPLKAKGRRKSRDEAKRDAIVYYLMMNTVDRSVLQRQLGIRSEHSSYTKKRGEGALKTLPDSLVKHIKAIMEES